jgi:hypothetical protein
VNSWWNTGELFESSEGLGLRTAPSRPVTLPFRPRAMEILPVIGDGREKTGVTRESSLGFRVRRKTFSGKRIGGREGGDRAARKKRERLSAPASGVTAAPGQGVGGLDFLADLLKVERFWRISRVSGCFLPSEPSTALRLAEARS